MYDEIYKILVYFLAWCTTIGALAMMEKLLTGMFPFGATFLIIFSMTLYVQAKYMTSINRGYFTGKLYTKDVSFNKAVLWKDRQLSIPRSVYDGTTTHQTTTMRFTDRVKCEIWTFDVAQVKKAGEWKTVGQEEQFYFPIELAEKTIMSE